MNAQYTQYETPALTPDGRAQIITKILAATQDQESSKRYCDSIARLENHLQRAGDAEGLALLNQVTDSQAYRSGALLEMLRLMVDSLYEATRTRGIHHSSGWRVTSNGYDLRFEAAPPDRQEAPE